MILWAPGSDSPDNLLRRFQSFPPQQPAEMAPNGSMLQGKNKHSERPRFMYVMEL